MALTQDTPADAPPASPETLIPEAREIHRRRRRRRWGAALIGMMILAGGGFALFGGGGAPAGPQLVSASPSAIGSFLAEARRGTEGTFSETYRVTVHYAYRVRQLEIRAAQRSPRVYSYEETPSLLLSRPGGLPASHSYEVFEGVRAGRQNLASLYSCSQARPSSRWSCTGPYTGIGMGETGALVGQYPPQALLLGLDNAVEAYTGRPAGPAIHPQPAFLSHQRLAGRIVDCLSFGRRAHVVGKACLGASGVIAYYDISQSVSYSSWAAARLLAYSPAARADAFVLPAAPQPANMLRSGY